MARKKQGITGPTPEAIEQGRYPVEMAVSADPPKKRSHKAKARGEEIRERQELAGIPESKRFGGSPESDAEFDRRRVMSCHVGGVSVKDMPLLTQRMIHYEQTDEGFAEKNAARTGIGATVSQDATDKLLRERDHDLKNMVDPRYAANPLKFLDKYKRPGFSTKLLNTRDGEVDPDYTVVKNAKGDPVRYKSMVLGERPTEEVKQRNRAIRGRSTARLKHLQEKFREEAPEVRPEYREEVVQPPPPRD